MTATLLLLTELCLASDLTPAPPAEETEEAAESEEEDSWSVDAPPGESVQVAIDTSEGTWISVDVSPDGEQLVFDLLGDLYLLPIEGGEAQALTSGVAWDMQPVWSPDGERIAFTSDRGGGDNLWVMEADGSGAEPVTTESFRLYNGPSWHPDGHALVGRKHFTSRRSLGAGEMWLHRLDGGSGLQLTQKQNDQLDVNEPVFSPDGRSLYYSQDATGGPTFQYNKDPNPGIYAIQRLDLDSGETQRVAGGFGGACRPTPSPDGERLAYVSRRRGQSVLMLKELDSGQERILWEGLDRDMQETWAIHGVYPHMSWTPDGESIVLWAQGGLHRVSLDGSARAIPFRVKDERAIRPALRRAVEVAPEEVEVKVLRDVEVSPDGQTLAFQALGRIWIQRLPDGQPQRLTRQDEHQEFDPHFSPDGKRIVFATWDDQSLGTVRETSLRGGRERVLIDAPGHYLEPTWLDEDQLAYRRVGGGWLRSPLWSDEPGIYLWDRRQDRSQRVLESGSDLHRVEGDARLFYSLRSGGALELRALDLTQREEQTLARTEMGVAIRVSSDGRWIAWREHYNAHLTPFERSGRSLDLSPGGGALAAITLSEDAGNELHFAGDRLWWTTGPVLYGVQPEEAWSAHQREEELPEVSGLPVELSRPRAQPEGRAALVGARLVTMRGDEVIEDGTLLWEGSRILELGPREEVQLPEGTEVFDGEGLTVLPGLIDVHAHGGMADRGIQPEQNWIQLSNLSFGVTTIHDPSNNTEMIFSASERQAVGDLLAPRIFSTGTILYGAKSPGGTAQVSGLDDALSHLRRLQAVGAFSVKSYNQPRRDQRQQVVEAGQQLGVMVVPEGGSTLMHNLTMLIDGHTGIEHALPLSALYDDVLQLWSQTEVGYTPTLGVAYGGPSGERYWYANTRVWEDERLLQFVPQRIVDSASRRRETIPEEEYHHDDLAAFCKELVDAGGIVQIGAHGQREGLAAHWELWMLEQGGMSPHEALRSGTLHGAKYLGLDGDLGSLEPGKLADLMVIEGNPLEDLRRSRELRYTILGGQVLESHTLRSLWPLVEERQPLYWQQGLGEADPERDESLGCSCTHH